MLLSKCLLYWFSYWNFSKNLVWWAGENANWWQLCKQQFYASFVCECVLLSITFANHESYFTKCNLQPNKIDKKCECKEKGSWRIEKMKKLLDWRKRSFVFKYAEALNMYTVRPNSIWTSADKVRKSERTKEISNVYPI